MFRVLIDKTKVAIRYLKRLHAEIAEAQQYLVPALMVASAVSAVLPGGWA